MFEKIFRDHPASVGESYFQHMRQAMGFSLTLFRASLVCLIHAFIPCLFKKTGSEAIQQLHHRMVTHRDCRHVDGNTEAEPSGVKS